MGETNIKAMLEFIIPRLIRMLMEKRSLTEKQGAFITDKLGFWQMVMQSTKEDLWNLKYQYEAS